MIFSQGPYMPMDKEYYSGGGNPGPKLEKPIFSATEIGQTVPDVNPMTGGHILQNVDAAIKTGASKLQIVMTPRSPGLGSMGTDVRQTLKEVMKATGATIEGIELPTSSMSNLSGFDPQHGSVSDVKRQRDLEEVKNAIRFVADLGSGGGVDIWSQEFSRNIYNADWNKKGKWAGKFEAFKDEKRLGADLLVDPETGGIQEVKHSSKFFAPKYKSAESEYEGKDVDGKSVRIKKGDWVTEDGKLIDPYNFNHLKHRVVEWNEKEKKFNVDPMAWEDIIKRTDEFNQRQKELGRDVQLTPAQLAFRMQVESHYLQMKGNAEYHSHQYNQTWESYQQLKKAHDDMLEREKSMTPEQIKELAQRFGVDNPSADWRPSQKIAKDMNMQMDHLKYIQHLSGTSDAQADETLNKIKSFQPIDQYAKAKAMDSYATAGIYAMQETENRKLSKPIHVGPELGWPTAYGGHPEEFIELIKGSRQKMIEALEKQGYNPDAAKKAAKTHISGCFDTGHMGMWLEHFDRKPGEKEEDRIKRFNGWYMDMVKKMRDEDVIGSVQAVDSKTASHAHLPPGEGIFPVVDAVKLLKEGGFDGFIVSEGHEEEQYGHGRILLQTWKAFGADITSSYFANTPARRKWGDVSESYFGYLNPPPYVVGEYRPSDDWVFWSGVPLE